MKQKLKYLFKVVIFLFSYKKTDLIRMFEQDGKIYVIRAYEYKSDWEEMERLKGILESYEVGTMACEK